VHAQHDADFASVVAPHTGNH